jgi:ABC-type thiamine transport system ATPase subunit
MREMYLLSYKNKLMDTIKKVKRDWKLGCSPELKLQSHQKKKKKKVKRQTTQW